jgi:hypothetical protein
MTENKEINKSEKVRTVVRYFFWDIVLMTILILNFILLIWDWFYSIELVYGFFTENFPAFSDSYSTIHANIKLIDLAFVAVYMTDFIVGWIISVVKHKEKKYQYPLSHWYDLLGCIPSGSLIFLRLLRVVSIIIRLHKKRLINVSKWTLVKKGITIYNIAIEEISDRVVLNILNGIKHNICMGTPVSKLIFSQIIEPQKQRIIDIVFDKLKTVSSAEYSAYKDEIADYVRTKTKEAISSNREVSLLTKVPVVGSQIKGTLEKSVSTTITGVIDNIASDLLSDGGQKKLKTISSEVTDSVMKDLENDLRPVITDIVLATVDIIAKTANVKQWKLANIETQILNAKNAAKPDEGKIKKLEEKYNQLLIEGFFK